MFGAALLGVVGALKGSGELELERIRLGLLEMLMTVVSRRSSFTPGTCRNRSPSGNRRRHAAVSLKHLPCSRGWQIVL